MQLRIEAKFRVDFTTRLWTRQEKIFSYAIIFKLLAVLSHNNFLTGDR